MSAQSENSGKDKKSGQSQDSKKRQGDNTQPAMKKEASSANDKAKSQSGKKK